MSEWRPLKVSDGIIYQQRLDKVLSKFYPVDGTDNGILLPSDVIIIYCKIINQFELSTLNGDRSDVISLDTVESLIKDLKL